VQRFTSVDPLAEKKPWMSPYVYCSDNPVNRIDPDGRDDTSGTPTKKNKNGVDTTPQSTTAVKVPDKKEPVRAPANYDLKEAQKTANKTPNPRLEKTDKIVQTPEDKAVTRNPLVQAATVVAVAPAVGAVAVAAAGNAVVVTESSVLLTTSAGAIDGYIKAKTNAPPDSPYLIESPFFQVPSDIVNFGVTKFNEKK